MASQTLDVTFLLQQWQRLTKRQQLLALCVGGALILWVTDAAVLRPLRHRVRQLHHDVGEAERRLVDAFAASDQAPVVDKAFAAYTSFVHAAASSETELASLLTEVESAVRQSGMVLVNLKPLPGRQGGTNSLNVTVEGEASPAQLMQLLDQLHRSTNLLKVTELSIRVVEGKTAREGKTLYSSMVVSKLLLQ